MPSPPASSDLLALYEFCRTFAGDCSPSARQAFADAILLHPASQARLDAACSVVLRQCPALAEIRDDVEQEARLVMRQHLLLRPAVYEDRGLNPFGCWLWTMWLYACRDGWRRSRPSRWNQLDSSEVKPTRSLPGSGPESVWAKDLVLVVYERCDPLLQNALLDWLGGLSLRQSATRLGLSKAAVVKLRQRLVTLFHRARQEELE